MKKSTTNRTAVKTATVATKRNSNTTTTSTCPHTSKKVCKNIYKVLGTGSYRVRMIRNGVKYSRNFNLLREAKAWIASL